MEKQKEVFKRISAIIGNTTPDTIEHIINYSNKNKLIYHGIKKGKYAEKIKQEGIKPLTPECGWCSFWSTDQSLFQAPIDSPFFRWSGGYSRELEGQELNLAVTSYELLEKRGIKLPVYKEDSQILLYDTIPYEDIVILNIKLKSKNRGRKYGQITEQMLLELIIQQISEGITPGQTITVSKEIK